MTSQHLTDDLREMSEQELADIALRRCDAYFSSKTKKDQNAAICGVLHAINEKRVRSISLTDEESDILGMAIEDGFDLETGSSNKLTLGSRAWIYFGVPAEISFLIILSLIQTDMGPGKSKAILIIDIISSGLLIFVPVGVIAASIRAIRSRRMKLGITGLTVGTVSAVLGVIAVFTVLSSGRP